MLCSAENARGRGRVQFVLALLALCFNVHVWAEIEHNTINEDGSYSFRHSNDDIGGYYHSASASPDNIVRGRYGSRSPANGQVEEVVYTAGPRGFRANGPKIHRKMDLAQFPVRPRGSPDDPLADPYDDPTYSFSYRAADQSRSENSDATGRVRGLYSYLDDVGERHTVRYAAGAGTGFEVLNAVPDNPISVAYSAPLYKAHPKARGKMTVQRGPDGSYKLIAAGPDQRRAESRGPDGLVRGTYSYLDDVGVQRTVEYIAGAGIGYRIVKNRMGPGTHINPSLTEFRLSDTDFKLAGDFGRGAEGGALSGEGGGSAASRGVGSRGAASERGGSGASSGGGGSAGSRGGGGGGGRGGGGGGEYLRKDHESDNDIAARDNVDREGASSTGGARERVKSDRMGAAASNRGGTRYRGGDGGGGGVAGSSASGSSFSDVEDNYDTQGSRGGSAGSSTRGGSNRPTGNRNRDRDRNAGSESRRTGGTVNSRAGGGAGYSYDPPSTNNYQLNDDDVGSLPPLITANRKILEIDRERDWVQRHRDSTVIKNVGKWYIGLPPGQSVRAHVQNIDLLPLGGRRVPSPSEALRQDEIADMVASLESEGSYSS